jgi:mannan endo-1,4-beta-mannosidase
MKTRLFIFLLFCATLLHANTGNGNFQIIGSKIIDPDGNEFIPRGVNVQGMKWVWPGNIVPQADLIINAWKFNIIRVNCRLYDGFWNGQNVSINAHYQTIESMQAIVDAFTPHKVVVKFEFHDRTGSYYAGNDLEDLKDAFREMSDRWGDNPYVWFNIMNEPGGSSPDLNQWVNMHREVIQVIRDEMLADNVIVIDAHYWGQDIGVWNANPVPEGNSSILSRGHDLLNFNDKTYENIMFSFHIYDQWNRGTPEQIEFKLHDYIVRVKEKGFALMIGEFGTNRQDGSLYFPDAFIATMKVAPAHGIGLIWWHWYGGDALKLTTTGNGNGGNINSTTNPTNLTWPGQMFWDYSTFQGNNQPFVTIYNPISTQNITSGSNFTLRIAAADFDDGIKEVRLYQNNHLLETFTSEPYEYLIENVESGRYPFKAVAVDNAGNETTSSVVAINVTQSPNQGNLLFVTGQQELSASDNSVYDQMLKADYRVFHKTQADVREIDATNRLAVILSSSVTSASVGNTFRNTAVPILAARPELFSALRMTGNVSGTDFGFVQNQKDVIVADESHVIAEGLSGTIDVYEQPADVAFGKPAPGAEIIMASATDPEKASLFVFPSKSTLIDMIAPASRAAWYASANEDVILSGSSLKVFRNLLAWVVENISTPVNVDNLQKETIDLRQNYPNPVRDYTTIDYSLTATGRVKLSVFDQKGTLMDVLVNEIQVAGIYSVVLNASDKYASGIYYYSIQIDNDTRTRFMLIQR